MRSILSCILVLSLVVGCSSEDIIFDDEPITTIEYTYLEHNQWIYAQMNHNYLWRGDMPDSLDCNYGLSPQEFFKHLLSPKDRFSYMTNNPSYSPPNAYNYGIAYQMYSDIKGNHAMQILYTTSEKAKSFGIKRGDFFQVINQQPYAITLAKVLLDGNGTFVKDVSPEIELSSETSISNPTVIVDSVYCIDNKKIGYLCYTEYDEVLDLYIPLKKFLDNRISDLILDLRYNPGGYVSTCRFLCNCIVPENAYQQIFQQCSYNDILSKYYEKKTGKERTYTYFVDLTKMPNIQLGIQMVPLNLSQIYILTSQHTASASEATIVCLRPYMDVTIIGDTTVGKGVGSWGISNREYKYALHPITMRYYNEQGESTPDEGLSPDYFVPDGYSTRKTDLGNIEEPLLHQALQLICPNMFPIMRTRENIQTEEYDLTPIGDPSYITEYNQKQNRI